MDKKEIREKLEKGWISINIIFELIGNPKEHIEKAMTLLLEQIEKDKDVLWLDKDVGEAEETTDGLFGTFCEANLLVKDLSKLSYLAINYSPASIEIIEPASMTFKDKDLNHFFGDLLSQMHVLNTKTIELSSINRAYEKNINALLRNFMLVALADKELTGDELGKKIGVPGKDLKLVFDAMEKEGKIEKMGDKYKRI